MASARLQVLAVPVVALWAVGAACTTAQTAGNGSASSSSTTGGIDSTSNNNVSGQSGSMMGASSSGSPGTSSGVIIRTPDDTNPDNNNRDSDCDGLTDEEEFGRTYAGGAHTSPNDADSDDDGVLDGVEAGATAIVAGDAAACGTFVGDQDPTTTTNPTARDSDGDGIADGAEDHNGNGREDDGESDPTDLDSDGDGLPDALEDTNHDGTRTPDETSAASRDTDGDGIPDGVEDVNHDGIKQPSETNPREADTDGDGLTDGDEDPNWNHIIDPGETSPLVADLDTDHDGIPDSRETMLGYDISNPDMDGDGLKDGEEDRNKNGITEAGETNPRKPDSDCDGLKDGEEDANHDGTVQATETDPLARDSDGDLLPDGLERGVTVNPDPTGCPMFRADADSMTTNPRSADTDGDHLNDGIEDKDRDGQKSATETDPNNADTDGDTVKDGDEDLNHNGVLDVGETNPLVADLSVDTDSDGLPDDVEMRLGTSISNPDTDGDQLPDGLEDRNRDGVISIGETNPTSKDSDCDGIADGEEDANHDGTVQATETDPLDNDTDGDNVLDGVELGRTMNLDATACTTFVAAAQPPTVTNPLDSDTDDDGVSDGTEDANQNGRVDSGELNPKVGTDVTPVVQQACALGSLTPITFHNTETPRPDIQVATIASFTQEQDIKVFGQTVGKFVVDGTAAAPVVAFAFSRAPAPDEPTADALQVHSLQAMASVGGGVQNPITQALPCLNFPTDCTWDGFKAVLGSYDLQFNGDAFAAGNALIAALVPNATNLLTGSLGITGPFKLRMQFVRRSANKAVIVGAIMPASRYSVTTAFHVEDVANGTALAQVGDATGVQCDQFQTRAYPKSDILLVIDNSGSMGDDQQALSLASDAMMNQLQNALLDWRIGRITTDTDDPHDTVNDTSVRVPVTYGDGTLGGSAPARHWPFIHPADQTLAAFAQTSQIVKDKLMQPGTDGWGSEATMAALRFVLRANPDTAHRLLPSSPAGVDDPWKIRNDARLAVLIVSDAGEQSNFSGRQLVAGFDNNWDDQPAGNILQFLRGGPNNGVALAGTPDSATWEDNRLTEPAMFVGGIFCTLGNACSGEESSTGLDPNTNMIRPEHQRYYTMVNSLGGVIGSIDNVNNIAPAVTAFMTAVIGSASPYVLSKAPISASIKVSIDGQPNTGCTWTNIPRSRVNGFDYDGATRQITFYGNCRPSNDPQFLGRGMAISYRYWVDRTPDADGANAPCGGMCVAPLVCNSATNMCECPSDCGMAAGCGAPQVCDTRPTVCACACPADCGGSPSNPRLVCNPGTCTFDCPSDCGGPSPGPSFACNPTTCRYECGACNPADKPTQNPDRWVCDLATCQWTCPEDCAATSPGEGYRCNRQTCEYTCTPDCGGTCSGLESCNGATCGCMCQQNVTCGAGLRFDATACACVCDTAALGCSGAYQADADRCSCACKPNCGDTCGAGEVCNQSLCTCQGIGG